MSQNETDGDAELGTEVEQDETNIYEVQVALRQTALVAVEAESREAAWDKVEMNHDRETQEFMTRADFTGAHYEPEDIIAVNNVDEADLTVGDDDE